MSLDNISKSKIVQIESMAKSIQFSFGSENEELHNALGKLIKLIEEEKDSREKLRDRAWAIANKL